MTKHFFYKQVAYNPALKGRVFVGLQRQSEEQTQYNGEEFLGGVLAERVPEETQVTTGHELPIPNSVFYGGDGKKWRRVGTDVV